MKIQRPVIWLIFIFLVLLLSTVRAEQIKIWDAEAIAKQTGLSTNLLDGQTYIATVSVNTVRHLIEIKDKISAVSHQPARLLIATGNAPNAFATKENGEQVVAINLAMIKLMGDDWDAYAAIMGHEISHLTLGHRETRVQRESTRTLASNLLGLILGKFGVPLGGSIADLGTQAVSTSFSREEESAADKLGMRYMVEAGFDPQGGVRVWDKMSGAAKSSSLPFLSTHPSTQTRLDEMRMIAAQSTKMSTASSTIEHEKPSGEKNISDSLDIKPDSEIKIDPLKPSRITDDAPINISKPQKKSNAVGFAENAVAENPLDATAWYRLGAAHLDDKNYDKAVISFEEALKIKPKFPEAIFGLGTTYYSMGKTEQTKELYPKLRRVSPEIAKLYFKMYLLP